MVLGILVRKGIVHTQGKAALVRLRGDVLIVHQNGRNITIQPGACSYHHAFFYKDSKGELRIQCLNEESNVRVNGETVCNTGLKVGDFITIDWLAFSIVSIDTTTETTIYDTEYPQQEPFRSGLNSAARQTTQKEKKHFL